MCSHSHAYGEGFCGPLAARRVPSSWRCRAHVAHYNIAVSSPPTYGGCLIACFQLSVKYKNRDSNVCGIFLFKIILSLWNHACEQGLARNSKGASRKCTASISPVGDITHQTISNLDRNTYDTILQMRQDHFRIVSFTELDKPSF